ncbi:hypothetical protein ALC53_10574 [Atta colombica]|uniref:Mos1 transposase HTH domain-containing protein n=1 Tax=Atta colombica TaxID=520822 RepID=A0A195B419_9HYME|nr:hypothetical protein ALC53_10574 [Atta colombica]
MSVYEPNSRHLREVLIFCFNMKKSTAEAHRMLSNTYDEALARSLTHSFAQTIAPSSSPRPRSFSHRHLFRRVSPKPPFPSPHPERARHNIGNRIKLSRLCARKRRGAAAAAAMTRHEGQGRTT